MNKEQKRELAREALENMNLNREQYLEMCRLCDDLGLSPKRDEPVDPEEMDWDEIINNQ